MSSTSNQETFRADLEGRITFDLLRQVGFAAPHHLRSQIASKVLSCRRGRGVTLASCPHGMTK
jgi:hypothetical protein